MLSQKPFWEMIKIVSRDTSPPLYYICEHFWFKFFGTSEVAIRSLSFLFFLGTVLTVGLIAKEIGKKKTIFWATLLTFLNPFLFKYAFEGRMYSILAFTTTLSFYFFLKVLRSTPDRSTPGVEESRVKLERDTPGVKLRWQIAYVLSAAAALYSHHFAIFAIFIQGVWKLTEIIPKPSFKKVYRQLWVYPTILLLYIPWLPSLYYQTTLVGSGFWLKTPNLKDLASVILGFILGPEKYPLIKLSLLFVLLSLAVRRWNFKKKIDWILLSWFLGPIFLTFILSQFFQSIFFDRYMLFAIPGLTLLLASKRRNIISPVILLILVIILGRYNWSYFTHPAKRPFKEFSNYMKAELTKGGKIINWNAAAHHLWESKYYGIPGPIYSPGGPLPFYVGTAQMSESDVIYKLPDIDRLGVITSGPVEEVVLPNYQLVELKEFGELKGLWFEFEKESN